MEKRSKQIVIGERGCCRLPIVCRDNLEEKTSTSFFFFSFFLSLP